MTGWPLLLLAVVLALVGVVIHRNAGSISRETRASQQRYLGFWARPDDQIDRPGTFGQNSPRAREAATRGVGIVAMVMAAAALLLAVSRFLGWGL